MTGKNFSFANLGQRRKADFYETPYSMTKQLLEVEEISGSVLEPAYGKGAILGFLPVGTVFYDADVDFLIETRQFDCIVTNPPYSLAFEFILKAKKVALNKFCFLLPLAYLHGKKRFDTIYSDRAFPLARIYVFTRYPMLGDSLRQDGKYRTGMLVYAWFVWQRSHQGEPVIRWLDNQPYILSARDV